MSAGARTKLIGAGYSVSFGYASRAARAAAVAELAGRLVESIDVRWRT